MTPDLSQNALDIRVTASDTENCAVEATAYDGDEEVGTVTGPTNGELHLPVPDPQLWSPDTPFLYDLEVELIDRQISNAQEGRTIDAVESYFGMRSVGMEEINGTVRPTLNGEFVFQMATLDQGFWPDGIYTPPTDEALKFDLEQHKEMGFNTVRKHSKVENNRWFYHADTLGLLVW